MTESNLTPAREVRERVLAYLAKHPDADWQDIYKNVENHYAHFRSLRTAMRNIVKRDEWNEFMKGHRMQDASSGNDFLFAKPRPSDS